MQYPLITVITPSYNSGSYIFETIHSVLEQTYPAIQYIITDDASKEFPADIIKEVLTCENRGNIVAWTVLHHVKNVGTVKNLNGALHHADGEYIFIIAADDAYDNVDVLSQWVKEFQNTHALAITSYWKNCDVNLCDCQCIFPNPSDAHIIRTYTPERLYQLITELHFQKKPLPIDGGGAIAYSRECIDRYNLFDETYKLMEDYPTIATLLKDNVKIYLWGGCSIKHRYGGVSHNSIPNPKLVLDFIKFKEQILFNNNTINKKMFFYYYIKYYLYRACASLYDILYRCYYSHICQSHGSKINSSILKCIGKIYDFYRKI